MCARGGGIRGSKDLRAEIGKFPNSTNERKQMSNKTLKQRIALVAASALTAGFLSVVATPSANAFNTEDGYISATTGSTGLVSSTLASNVYDTTKTAVLLKTGSLVLTVTSTGGNNSAVTVSSGAVITAQSGAASNINADQTCAIGATGSTFTIVPTGAVGSTFTISLTSETTCATAATLTEKATVTIAGTDLSGTAVAANSYVNWVADDVAANSDPSATESAANAADTTGNLLYIGVRLRDAYKAEISSTSGALIATASAGAVVKIAAATAATKGTAATSVSSADPSDLYISVGEATDGAGWVGTVTVTYNGVVMATKSGKISGKASKLTVAALKVGDNSGGGATTAGLAYQVSDAAGNNIVTTATTIVYSSSTNAAMVSAAVGTNDNTTSDVGLGSFTCANSASLYGTADIVLQTTLADGTVLLSNPVKVTCGGKGAAYTASWDKATYAQGDVAKLTIQFKDAKGAVANSMDIVGAAGTADQVITANQMERVTAHSASATPDKNGQLVYTFTVGTSTGIVPGKYNAVVSFPTVNTEGAALGTSNISVPYEISGGTAVSNADVLKSIVALIASINKQIQALQKLILKR